MNSTSSIASHLMQALFPTTCAACGQVLADGERQLCLECLGSLAATGYGAAANNAVEQRLTGRVPYVAATALYHFRLGDKVRQVVHAMKFDSCTALCLMMGRQMGMDLVASGRFDDVDVLLPVPLHWHRRLQRGYNQSELLCRGIAAVMPRPVSTDTLYRRRRTAQQSRSRHSERADNVAGAFAIRHAERLQGRHVLLVDDVVTTGATLAACADALAVVPDLRISVATLSAAN